MRDFTPRRLTDCLTRIEVRAGSENPVHADSRAEHTGGSIPVGSRVPASADKHNLGDNQDEIASRVTCTLAYTQENLPR